MVKSYICHAKCSFFLGIFDCLGQSKFLFCPPLFPFWVNPPPTPLNRDWIRISINFFFPGLKKALATTNSLARGKSKGGEPWEEPTIAQFKTTDRQPILISFRSFPDETTTNQKENSVRLGRVNCDFLKLLLNKWHPEPKGYQSKNQRRK